MPSGIVLGVATAVAWGSSDFLARFATRSVGSVRALLGNAGLGRSLGHLALGLLARLGTSL